MNHWKTYALALEAYHDNAMAIANEVDRRTGPSLKLLEEQRNPLAAGGRLREVMRVLDSIRQATKNLAEASGDGLTGAELIVACRNIGFDLTCGACAGQFYTGAQLGEHTCPSHGPDDNYDTINCPSCDGSGLAPSPIRDMVLQFHATFLPEQTAAKPNIPSDDLVRLRLRLIFEEAFELLNACIAPGSKNDAGELWANIQRLIHTGQVWVNLIEVADAFADLAYVVEGGNLAFGIDSRVVLAEVHKSNMSKLGGHRREDGKWVKPSTYSPPDISGALRKQGWNG